MKVKQSSSMVDDEMGRVVKTETVALTDEEASGLIEDAVEGTFDMISEKGRWKVVKEAGTLVSVEKSKVTDILKEAHDHNEEYEYTSPIPDPS